MFYLVTVARMRWYSLCGHTEGFHWYNHKPILTRVIDFMKPSRNKNLPALGWFELFTPIFYKSRDNQWVCCRGTEDYVVERREGEKFLLEFLPILRSLFVVNLRDHPWAEPPFFGIGHVGCQGGQVSLVL